MKNLFLSLLLIPLIGCTTLNSSSPTTATDKIVTGVSIASQLGGTLVLAEHPEYRPGFVQAVDDLQILTSGTNEININDVLAIISRLNIKQLKSPQATLYVTSGILLIKELGGSTSVPLDQSNNVRAVATALQTGLEYALDATANLPIPTNSVPQTLNAPGVVSHTPEVNSITKLK